jgi:hypothetical protein
LYNEGFVTPLLIPQLHMVAGRHARVCNYANIATGIRADFVRRLGILIIGTVG